MEGYDSDKGGDDWHATRLGGAGTYGGWVAGEGSEGAVVTRIRHDITRIRQHMTNLKGCNSDMKGCDSDMA